MFERAAEAFDRSGFWRDISGALRRPPGDDPVREYIRSRGLRIVVQTAQPEPKESVLGRIRDAWGDWREFDISLTVSRLFGELPGQEFTPEPLRLFHLVIVPGVDPDNLELNIYDACYALTAQQGIQSVEPDLPYLRFVDEDTNNFGSTSKPADKAWALRKMQVEQAWGLPSPVTGQKDGAGVLIAHLDTGWTKHDDLDSVNFDSTRAYDFITNGGIGTDPLTKGFLLSPGHGTRTGSVMMSRGGIGPTSTLPDQQFAGEITGLARDARYVPIRCIKSVMVIFTGDIASAVRHATAQSCHVISMSLGGRPLRALRQAIQDAVKNNLLVVAAAGNEIRIVVYPGRYPECITVGATDDGDKFWWRSSRGKAVDVSAPGVDVWAAEPKSPPTGTKTGSGTSYATAHTAGAAALWLAFFNRADLIAKLAPGANLQDVFRDCLRSTAHPGQKWRPNRFGAGIVNVYKLLLHPPGISSVQPPQPDKNSLNWWLQSPHLAWRLRAWKRGHPESHQAFEHELINLELDHAPRTYRPERARADDFDWVRQKLSQTLLRFVFRDG